MTMTGSAFRLGAGMLFVVRAALAAAPQAAVTAEWRIRTPDSAHPAIVRAAKDLQTFMRARHGVELRITQQAGSREIVLRTAPGAAENGFRVWVAPDAQSVTVEGATPLSVYQGVFLLEDQFSGSATVTGGFDRRVAYPFKDRYVLWDAMLTGQNKEAIGFDLERHVREAVRLGYTGLEVNRFVGMTLVQQNNPRDPYPWYTYWGPSMDQFVSSPLFDGVFDKAYLARNLADLKHVAEVVSSFGLKPIFMGYEPRYVPDSFLARHPEMRGPRVDHPLRSMQHRYSAKAIEDDLRSEVKADLASFEQIVNDEIQNTQGLAKLVSEGGEFGMVLLPQETTWGYGPNFAELLQKKIESMKRHLPEARDVLNRWFGSY